MGLPSRAARRCPTAGHIAHQLAMVVPAHAHTLAHTVNQQEFRCVRPPKTVTRSSISLALIFFCFHFLIRTFTFVQISLHQTRRETTESTLRTRKSISRYNVHPPCARVYCAESRGKNYEPASWHGACVFSELHSAGAARECEGDRRARPRRTRARIPAR